jgi:uncharacterized repeat protein (TIGR03803 family)
MQNRSALLRVSCLTLGLLAVSSAVHAQAPFSVLGAFGLPGPQSPQAPMIQAADGNFYGTTSQGGGANAGTVFQLTPAGVLSQVYAFTGGADGGYPYAGLVQGTDGNLYGTTSQGGAGGVGTIFQVTSSGALTVLYSFTGGTDGASPYAGLVQGTDGNFYGTSSSGGATGVGTVFQITAGGAFAVVYTFTGAADGASPYAGLVQGTDGNFYGTASSGGASSAGTVFQLTPSGGFTVLYSFTGGADGGFPVGSVIQASDGNLYGTTYQGGNVNAGVVFQLAPSGSLNILYTFTGAADGAYPYAGVIQGADGAFYGTALLGGDPNAGAGTVFRVTAAGSFNVLHAFTGATDGANPAAALTIGTDGNFYGTTYAGGAAGGGTAFLISSVVTPTITWNTPAPIAFGTPLTAAQLNATANVPGTFVYSPPAGTVLHGGAQTLTVTFTPGDSSTYATVTSSVTLVVTPLTPVVTWNTPAPIAYGTPLGGAQLNARARIPGTFIYSPAAGEVLPAGTQTLSVLFLPAAASDYTTVTRSVTLTVNVATPIISWAPTAMSFGAALGGLQLNATASTAGTFVYSPPAGTVLSAGTQTLSVVFTPADTTDYLIATMTTTVNVAVPGASGGGNEYPLQFTPAAGARGLVLAGYQLVADPVFGFIVSGNCSYYTVHSGSGKGGGYKTVTTYYNQTCTWDPFGRLLTVTNGAPAAPTPIRTSGTQTVYAANATGAYTGSDTALANRGFVFTPGSHYTWLTSNAYTVIQQALYTLTVTLRSDGDMPLNVSSVRASALRGGGASVTSTTCSGQIPVGSACSVTVTYDPTHFQSPTGLAYDTLDIAVVSDVGLVHDFVQSYTIVLTPANTNDGGGN